MDLEMSPADGEPVDHRILMVLLRSLWSIILSMNYMFYTWILQFHGQLILQQEVKE